MRRRLRKWAKWACTVAAAVLIALAALSGIWRVTYAVLSWDGDVYRGVEVREGVVWCLDSGGMDIPRGAVRRWSVGRAGRWVWGAHDQMLARGFTDHWHGGVLCESGGALLLGCTLIYPVLLASGVAALLWYADRRRFAPHECGNCGYDRSGLASEKDCPECGAVWSGR